MKMTVELAEFCGIHAGDGHLRKNGKGIELSGGLDEVEYYDNHVIPLLSKLLRLKISGKHFPSKGTYGINHSSHRVVSLLTSLGFPKGAKSKTVEIPKQIIESDPPFRRAFLRGLFDTDGCINFDKAYGNYSSFKLKHHYYPRILLTTVSKKLAYQTKELCESEGLKCYVYTYDPKKLTESKKYKLQIVGVKNLELWMNKIGFRNPSKLSRYKIWKLYGFCPPNTSYEERQKLLNGKLNPSSLYGPVAQSG